MSDINTKKQIEEAIRLAVRRTISEMSLNEVGELAADDDAEGDRLFKAMAGWPETTKWLHGDKNAAPEETEADEDAEDAEEAKPVKNSMPSRAEVGKVLGVTQQQIDKDEKKAINKLHNRNKHLSEADFDSLFDEYFEQLPGKQLDKVVEKFAKEAGEDAFAHDYADVLIASNDGGKDDLSDEEIELLRAHPEHLVGTEGYKDFVKSVSQDKEFLKDSKAFTDYVRGTLNFQNFVNELVQQAKAEKGITDRTPDHEATPKFDAEDE